jgi:hypothetical protein
MLVDTFDVRNHSEYSSDVEHYLDDQDFRIYICADVAGLISQIETSRNRLHKGNVDAHELHNIEHLISKLNMIFNFAHVKVFERKPFKFLTEQAYREALQESYITFEQLKSQEYSAFKLQVELMNNLINEMKSFIASFSVQEFVWETQRIRDAFINAAQLYDFPESINLVLNRLLDICDMLADNESYGIANMHLVRPWLDFQAGLIGNAIQKSILFTERDTRGVLMQHEAHLLFYKMVKLVIYAAPNGLVIPESLTAAANAAFSGPTYSNFEQRIITRVQYDQLGGDTENDSLSDSSSSLRPFRSLTGYSPAPTLQLEAISKQIYTDEDPLLVDSSNAIAFEGTSALDMTLLRQINFDEYTQDNFSLSEPVKCVSSHVVAFVSFLGYPQPSPLLQRAIIADTGASEHFLNNMAYFPRSIDMAHTGSVSGVGTLQIAGKGNAVLCGRNAHTGSPLTLVLHNASYVPDLMTSVLSISKINREGWRAVFQRNTSYICNADDTLRLDLTPHEGLFLLNVQVSNEKDERTETQAYGNVAVMNDDTRHSSTPMSAVQKSAHNRLMHQRMGHLSGRTLADTSRSVQGFAYNATTPVDFCSSCAVSKSKHVAHPRRDETRTREVGALVYSDLHGPLRASHNFNGTQSSPGLAKQYSEVTHIINAVDDRSRYTHVGFLRGKTGLLPFLERLVTIYKANGTPIRVFLTDWGGGVSQPSDTRFLRSPWNRASIYCATFSSAKCSIRTFLGNTSSHGESYASSRAP